MLIGNGWFNPILQYEAYYNFASNYSTQLHQGGNTYGIHYNASIDNYVYNNMYGAHNCLDQLLDCNAHPYATNASDGTGNNICNAADNFCYAQVEYPYDTVFGRDEYDIRYLTPSPFPYAFYVDYLNSEDVQAAIGAFTNFSESSSVTSTAFGSTGDDAREIGVTAAVEYLIDHNVTFVMYFGDADYNCNWFGGEAFSKTLSNVAAYTNGSAGFVNISTSDAIVHGQVKSAGKFSFVRIYESGHEVPFYQPLVSLEMVNRTINGLDIATGQTILTSSYITKGPVDTTFNNTGSTVTFDILPLNATYNVTTNQPNPPYNVTAAAAASRRLLTRYDRALLDAEKINSRINKRMREARDVDVSKWKAHERDVMPLHYGRDAEGRRKTGRFALFADGAKGRKHSHGHHETRRRAEPRR